ncbi:hypothetical protein [Alteromonas sp. KUL49]|uniref:hypothetical protein n=1 Tax=Alteromonas sp. KUL49 TaxID=2480798 RepID=UPI00102EDDF5|nr:hypothetical protein [Alteromonas sp. KUL49]TAP40985.1 hypothetical protein EYS00_07735 [Alteromonas sp. KUL49]GEA11176.1 hypothetical protein KUL49_15510 [Alteromonas sp. KUL49]
MKHLASFSVALILWLFLSSTSFSSNEPHKHHGEHDRVGSHGMVLFTDGAELYASHLPLYATPHDYQLVYLVDSANETDLLKRLTLSQGDAPPDYQQNIVTLLPDQFDLNQLINGESFEIDVQFFRGHFERNGERWFKEENLRFVRPVYRRSLSNLSQIDDSTTIVWDRIHTPLNQTQLYIFPIQAAPSFDAIVLGTSCPDTIKYLSDVPEIQQLEQTFSLCESSQLLYFETQDFVK